MKRFTDKEIANTIVGILRLEAHDAAQSAAYNGRWDDGGASATRNQADFYFMGQHDIFPSQWESYRTKAIEILMQEEHSKDPEYKEYLRLQQKFKSQ